MEKIHTDFLLHSLRNWIGHKINIHMEINPGGYFRNGKAILYNVHIKGNQSFRVFLELDEQQSIIQVDDLTHMMVTDELIVISAFDHIGRLERTIEISTKPFFI